MSDQDSAASAAKPGSHTVRNLEPVHADEPEVHDERWTGRLVIFLRVMAVLSMAKGLYHWAIVSGVIGPAGWVSSTSRCRGRRRRCFSR